MLGNDVIQDREKLNKHVQEIHLKIESIIRDEMKKLEVNNPDFIAEMIFVLLHTFANLISVHCSAIDGFAKYMGIAEKLNHHKFLEIINELVHEKVKELQQNDINQINITEH